MSIEDIKAEGRARYEGDMKSVKSGQENSCCGLTSCTPPSSKLSSSLSSNTTKMGKKLDREGENLGQYRPKHQEPNIDHLLGNRHGELDSILLDMNRIIDGPVCFRGPDGSQRIERRR